MYKNLSFVVHGCAHSTRTESRQRWLSELEHVPNGSEPLSLRVKVVVVTARVTARLAKERC